MRGRVEPGAGGWWAAAAGWLAGTALQLAQPQLWPTPAYAVLLLAGLVGAAVAVAAAAAAAADADAAAAAVAADAAAADATAADATAAAAGADAAAAAAATATAAAAAAGAVGTAATATATAAVDAAAAAAAAVTVAVQRRGGGRAAQRALVVGVGLCAAALGFGSTGWRAAHRLEDRLPEPLAGAEFVVTGVVARMPAVQAGGLRLVVDVESATDVQGRAVRLPRRVAVGWHADGEARPPPVAAGERWRWTLRLKPPHGSANPHGFDAELWWFTQGVGATGSVRAAPPPRRLAADVGAPVERWRQHVRDAIFARVDDAAAAGVLAALAVGDQASIARDDWDVFRATGVAHLMSISGLHVTMFAWLAGAAVGRLWRRGGRLVLALPAPQAARWGGLVCAAAYAVVAGWGVPAQRTVGMLAVVVALGSAGRRWPLPAVLAAAAVAVTMIEPWALLQPGFWLSFVAVALLALSEPAHAPRALRRPAPPSAAALADGAGGAPSTAFAAAAVGASSVPPGARGEDLDVGARDDVGADRWPAPVVAGRSALARIGASRALAWRAARTAAAERARRAAPVLADAARGGLTTQAVATVGLAPLSLLFFHQVSAVGFFANLVAIPLVTLLVTPLALAGVLLPPLWLLAAALVDALRAALDAMAGWPGALWTAGAAPAWAVAAGFAGALVAVLPLPWRLRALALPLLLPLLAPPLPRPGPGRFELVAADVGQGSAVLVRTATRLLVFDAGPRWGPEADAGERVLLPLLRARGDNRIDRLVLSHGDADHTGGAAALLAALPVAEVLGAAPPARRPGVAHRACAAGERWRWDGVDFEVLHPPPGSSLDPGDNAASCVLRIRGAAASVLLPGDLPAARERALVEAGADLAADVLLVPHHGSRSSSSEALVAAVAPRVAVVQAGYLNRFGHPAAEVAARYADGGVVLVRSDRCGAWTLAATGESFCEREIAPRYWHHRLASR